MELALTWGEAAEATRGTLSRGERGAAFSGFSTDSRRAGEGEAFWALKGRRYDAHEFLDERLARTASGWVVERGAKLPAGLPPHVLVVDDTLAALGDLAAFHRGRFELPVVGITGTNGKTTAKDMLASILARAGSVCATAGNLNNEIGLPLSVLELCPSHRFAVFEMGASRAGDIRALCAVARPTAGVLTNIGPAHLEFFGDIEGVLKAKSELIDGLPRDAPVAINSDDPMLARLLSGLGARAVTFGVSPEARVQICPGGAKGGIRLTVDGSKVRVDGAGFGAIHRLNAAAAAAAATALGLRPALIGEGLAAFKPSPLRFTLKEHTSGASLTVDTYNANPASMRAGIGTFLELAQKPRKLLVLGDMAELGADAPELHAEIGRWISDLPVDGVFLAGPLMAHASRALNERRPAFHVAHAADAGALAAPLLETLARDACAYFKASRSMRLEALVEAL